MRGQTVARRDAVQHRADDDAEPDRLLVVPAPDDVTQPALHVTHIGDHLRQWTVISNASPEDVVGAAFHQLVHDPAFEHAGIDSRSERSVSPDLVDRADVVLVTVLGRDALRQIDPKRRSEHVRLDVVGRDAVAREQRIDVPSADEGADIGRGPRMHYGRARNPQDAPPRFFDRAHLVGDLLHQQRLRLLAGDVGRHERERLARALRPLRRSDLDPETTHHDLHAGLDVCHRDRPGAAVADDDPAVHLRPLDLDPPAVDADLRLEVRRGVEAGRERSVHIGRGERGVGDAVGVRSVLTEPFDQGGQLFVGCGRDLYPCHRGVLVAGADLQVDHLEAGVARVDLVEHLGQRSAVHDVTFEGDRLRGHPSPFP